MTKEQAFEALKNIITCLKEKYFAEREGEDRLRCDLLRAMHENKFPAYWEVEGGASKAVILIPDVDYVIKIPFNSTVYDYDGIDEIDDWKQNDTVQCDHDFYSCANSLINTVNTWDYCEAEVNLYHAAVEEVVDTYFAEEGLLGYIDNYPIYWQQRCVPFTNLDNHSTEASERRSEQSREKCKKLGVNCFHSLWIADFIDAYGEDELKRLNDFLCTWGIDDLRGCNIGYIGGLPIIFDYSGFNEW